MSSEGRSMEVYGKASRTWHTRGREAGPCLLKASQTWGGSFLGAAECGVRVSRWRPQRRLAGWCWHLPTMGLSGGERA